MALSENRDGHSHIYVAFRELHSKKHSKTQKPFKNYTELCLDTYNNNWRIMENDIQRITFRE